MALKALLLALSITLSPSITHAQTQGCRTDKLDKLLALGLQELIGDEADEAAFNVPPGWSDEMVSAWSNYIDTCFIATAKNRYSSDCDLYLAHTIGLYQRFMRFDRRFKTQTPETGDRFTQAEVDETYQDYSKFREKTLSGCVAP